MWIRAGAGGISSPSPPYRVWPFGPSSNHQAPAKADFITTHVSSTAAPLGPDCELWFSGYLGDSVGSRFERSISAALVPRQSTDTLPFFCSRRVLS
jgi:hypothetical protein